MFGRVLIFVGLVVAFVCANVGLASCASASCDETATCAAGDMVSETTPDAASGGGPSDGQAGRFCSQVDAFYCADFDEPDFALPENEYEGNGTTMRVLADDGGSPPNALQISIPPVSASGEAMASYGIDAGSPKHLHLAFDMKVDYGARTAAIAIHSIGDDSYHVFITLDPSRPSTLALFEQTYNPPSEDLHYYDAGTPDFGAWRHIEVDLAYSTKNLYSLAVDGVATTGTLQRALPPISAFVVTAGIFQPSAATSATTVHFDNVALSVE